MTQNHDIVTAEITRQRVVREIKTFCMRSSIDMDGFLEGVEMSHFIDASARNMILQLTAKVASKVYDVKTVRFPKDWWNALKAYIYPKLPYWVSKKWPVKFTEVTMEANAYHPDICIPDHSTFVEILINTKEYGR
jgi:hypothetical protein